MDNFQSKACNIPISALLAKLVGVDHFPARSDSPFYLRVTPELHTRRYISPLSWSLPVMSFSILRRGSTLSLISYNSQWVERKMATTNSTRVCLIIANKMIVALYSHFDAAGTKQRGPQRPAFSTRKSIVIPWEITRRAHSTYCVLSLSFGSRLLWCHLPGPRQSCIGWLAVG